jgi:CheY-like chemotaxis protein
MGRTVLIVEDHHLNRQMLRMLVAADGHEVLEAGSAAEVDERLAQRTPDVILMDVHLPDGDGLDITRRLRADRRFDGVRIYAVTAYLMGEVAARARQAGCDGLLEKPIDSGKLLPALRS